MAIKKCAVCGKEFVDYGRGKYCNGPHYKPCKVCGEIFEYDVKAQRIRETCSKSCASKLRDRTKYNYKIKLCASCGKQFKPVTGNQQFCCKKCSPHI